MPSTFRRFNGFKGWEKKYLLLDKSRIYEIYAQTSLQTAEN